MKKYTLFLGVFALMLLATPAAEVSANTSYYYIPGTTSYQPGTNYTQYGSTYGASAYTSMNQEELVNYLLKLIAELQVRLANQNNGYPYNYGHGNYYDYKYTISNPRGDRDNDDDEPEADTESATNIGDDYAYLRGEVDMNDYDDGIVFFVYGTDEDQIEDVEDDYDSYRDVDEDGDDLQKVKVDNSLDGDDDYKERVDNLEENEDYFFQICVEWEDDDDDEVLTCGGVRDFETD